MNTNATNDKTYGQKLEEIQHIYFFTLKRTIFEWNDIFSNGQAAITKDTPIESVIQFCDALNANYNLWVDSD